MQGYEVLIQLPPTEPRPRGLLVDAASQITANSLTVNGNDRTGLGVQHVPWGCAPLWLGNADFCAEDVLYNAAGVAQNNDKEAAIAEYADLQVHPAFKMVDAIACSTMSFPDDAANSASMGNRLRNRMRTLSSYFLARELATGAASGGPALIDGQDLGSAATFYDAATKLEEFLGQKLFNGQGVIHMSAAIVHLAKASGWVNVEGGNLVTVSGHKVAADAGYGPPTGNAYTIFASGPIFYRVSDANLLGEGSETFLMTANMRERFAEAWGQLAFDECPVAQIDVTADATPIS